MGVRVVAAMVGLGLVAGCASDPVDAPTPIEVQAAPEKKPEVVQPGQAEQPGGLAKELVAGMTLREKVGQLFLPTVRDAAAGVQMVEKYRVGGFIYFPENLRTPAKTAKLSNELQAASRVPLIIGVDEETGIVSRVGFATRFPGAMALAASRDPELVKAAAATTGAELKAVGINLNFAPVADVNVNPANPVIGVRSFGSDPALVGQLTAAAIQGYRSAGVAAVAKHFPGHGDTATDSHTGLPVIKHSTSRWEQLDAPPFQAAIAQQVDAIMTAHIKVPGLDKSGRPATMSQAVLTGLLRDKMQYQGVIVTDSLQMAGARTKGGAPEAAVRAIMAGADQLLMPPSLPAAFNAVTKAVQSGRIPTARLDSAVERILRLKEIRGLFTSSTVIPADAESKINNADHKKVALDVATRAVTAIKNKNAFPIKGGVYVAGSGRAELAAALTKEGVRVTSPAEADTYVIVFTRTGSATERYLKTISARKKVIAVVAGSPYALTSTGTAHASLTTYSDSKVSLRGLARVLAGNAPATGRLPVALPKS